MKQSSKFILTYPGLLTLTVSPSVEAAQGQMASGLSPLDWNTERNWSQELRDQGLAPSATSSSRRDPRFRSRWSLVASRPQCRSRDLQMAILALCLVIICIQEAGLTCNIKLW